MVRMRYKTEDKERLLAAYRASGLSARAFAAQAGMSKGTFYNWLVKARLTRPRMCIAQVVRAEPPAEESRKVPQRSPISIFVGAARVEVITGFDTPALAQVLDVLVAQARSVG